MSALKSLLVLSTLAAGMLASTHAAQAAHLGPGTIQPRQAPIRLTTSFDGATVQRIRGRHVQVEAWGNVEGACTKERRAAAAELAREAARDLLSELGAPARRPLKVRFVDSFGDGLELRCEARVEVAGRRAKPRKAR